MFSIEDSLANDLEVHISYIEQLESQLSLSGNTLKEYLEITDNLDDQLQNFDEVTSSSHIADQITVLESKMSVIEALANEIKLVADNMR